MPAQGIELSALLARIDAIVVEHPAERVLIGIVGSPASGKTTLAQVLVNALLHHRAPWIPELGPITDADRPWIGSHVAHVPMDGYHLADVELRRLGRADRKGAPDTFDAAGYRDVLTRITRRDADVWAPAFDRELEQPIAGSIPVLRSTRVVVTEGNYLLLDDPEWAGTSELFAEVWFCDLDPDVRLQRLITRHIRYGKPPEAARAWASGPDQRNAELIDATRARADLVLTGDIALDQG